MALLTPGPIETYANAAARDSQLTKPAIGQGAFLIDTGALVFYYGPSLGWRPPWNSAWGEIQRAYISPDVGNVPINSVDSLDNRVPGLILTWVPVTNRQYVMIMDLAVTSGANGDFVDIGIRVYDPAGAIFRQTQQEVTISDVPFAPDPVRSELKIYAPDGGHFVKTVAWNQPHQVCVAANTNGGTGAASAAVASGNNQVAYLSIVDVGPVAGPVYR